MGWTEALKALIALAVLIFSSVSSGADVKADCASKRRDVPSQNGIIAACTQVIENESDRIDLANGYLARGVAYFRLEQYEEALADLSRVIDLVPRSPEAYKWRGLVYRKTGMRDAAIAELKEAFQRGDDTANDVLIEMGEGEVRLSIDARYDIVFGPTRDRFIVLYADLLNESHQGEIEAELAGFVRRYNDLGYSIVIRESNLDWPDSADQILFLLQRCASIGKPVDAFIEHRSHLARAARQLKANPTQLDMDYVEALYQPMEAMPFAECASNRPVLEHAQTITNSIKRLIDYRRARSAEGLPKKFFLLAKTSDSGRQVVQRLFMTKSELEKFVQ